MENSPSIVKIRHGKGDTMSNKNVSDKTTAQKGVTLVDYNAPWCAPCKAQKPIIEKLAAAYQGRIRVVNLNVDKNQKSAMQNGIASIPTMIIYKNGKEIDRFIGLQSNEVLSKAIDKALK